MQIPPAAGHDVKPSAFAAHSPPKGVQATGAINQSDTFLEKCTSITFIYNCHL